MSLTVSDDGKLYQLRTNHYCPKCFPFKHGWIVQTVKIDDWWDVVITCSRCHWNNGTDCLYEFPDTKREQVAYPLTRKELGPRACED